MQLLLHCSRVDDGHKGVEDLHLYSSGSSSSPFFHAETKVSIANQCTIKPASAVDWGGSLTVGDPGWAVGQPSLSREAGESARWKISCWGGLGWRRGLRAWAGGG
jgi:hypothetical protein